jgi:ketosteroid isomerase-like protein
MPEENVELVRDSFAAWQRGDLDWLERHTDPQVEIAQPPNLPGTSTYTGKEGLREALRDWPSQWEEFRIELIQATALDQGRVLAMTRQVGRGKGSGVEVEAVFAFLFTVRHGKLLRWQMFTSREEALEAAGLSE